VWVRLGLNEEIGTFEVNITKGHAEKIIGLWDNALL
jgi:hypothetical protein